MKPQPDPSTRVVLAGLVECVTYHNEENGPHGRRPRESSCSATRWAAPVECSYPARNYFVYIAAIYCALRLSPRERRAQARKPRTKRAHSAARLNTGNVQRSSLSRLNSAIVEDSTNGSFRPCQTSTMLSTRCTIWASCVLFGGLFAVR